MDCGLTHEHLGAQGDEGGHLLLLGLKAGLRGVVF